MKKIKNKILKYLGLTTLPLVLTPMVFGLTSNTSNTTTQDGTYKTLTTYNVFDKTITGQSSNLYKSRLTLQVTNNINLLTDQIPSVSLTPNTLSLFGTIDFSNATNKEEMKTASSLITSNGIVFARGFRTTLSIATENGDSALELGSSTTTNAGWINNDDNDYKVSFIFFVPPFDSFYNFNLSYATNGNFETATTNEIISTNVPKISIGRAGTNFDKYTKIITPFSVVNKTYDWNPTGNGGSYTNTSAKIYVDPSSYPFFKTWQQASNAVISGGLFINNGDKKYIIDLGDVNATTLTPDSNNLLNVNFAPGSFLSRPTYLYNEKNPTWDSPLTAPVDLSSSTASFYISIKITNPGPVQASVQLANPVHLNLTSSTSTATSKVNENDGTINVTASAQMTNNYREETEVETFIYQKGETSDSDNVELSRTVPRNVGHRTDDARMGYYSVGFELENNDISLSQTIIHTYSEGYVATLEENILPNAVVSTSYTGTNKSIISTTVAFTGIDSPTLGFSSFNNTNSKVKIYYNSKLVDTISFTQVARTPLPVTNYVANYAITSSQTNLALFSYSINLVYTVNNGTTTTNKNIPSNLFITNDSEVTQTASQDSSFNSVLIITMSVIGAILLAVIIWLLVDLRVKKNLNKQQKQIQPTEQ